MPSKEANWKWSGILQITDESFKHCTADVGFTFVMLKDGMDFERLIACVLKGKLLNLSQIEIYFV